ncbi:MAG TPA: class III extradiol dioxygenase subunit B-like domain-containing protein [Micromonosporaceae bacterium]|nr:class III extradiol dioxygenase subunit B-like domain-containing protein [Micromonosporaceae bacterium]
MPLVAAAVCPHPPLIVPEIAGAAASELEDLRRACDAAVEQLLDAEPARVMIIGPGSVSRVYGSGSQDTFARFGLPVPVRIGAGGSSTGPQRLPLSLLVGGWLLNRVGAPDVVARSVPDAWSAAECRALGREIGRLPEPVALLVMGDGTACRGEQSPGYDDPRAPGYDEEVAAALAEVDTVALLGLDPDLSRQLRVAGRAAWQVLAGAAEASGVDWRGDLAYHAAPYGVAYLVASWHRLDER